VEEKKTVRVKIGLADTPRELDIEVTDAESLVAQFEESVTEGRKLLWVTEEDGRRHGLVVDKIVYIDVEAEITRQVGFARS
jgi:hypothetical protein